MAMRERIMETRVIVEIMKTFSCNPRHRSRRSGSSWHTHHICHWRVNIPLIPSSSSTLSSEGFHLHNHHHHSPQRGKNSHKNPVFPFWACPHFIILFLVIINVSKRCHHPNDQVRLQYQAEPMAMVDIKKQGRGDGRKGLFVRSFLVTRSYTAPSIIFLSISSRGPASTRLELGICCPTRTRLGPNTTRTE